MTAGGCKETYWKGYVNQQTKSSSVISSSNNLQTEAGSLTHIGSLIAAANNATISFVSFVFNEAQAPNANWHALGFNSRTISAPTSIMTSGCAGRLNNVRGFTAMRTARRAARSTRRGGCGNIAGTTQAPNLSITSDGEIPHIGNVMLTGQKLIDGIMMANTYTPCVNGPSQMILMGGLPPPPWVVALTDTGSGSGIDISCSPGGLPLDSLG